MGTIGMVLAMIGLYGLMAYSVSRRTREFGIRLAVGAAPDSVLRLVLRRGMILAGVGIVIGVIGSIAVDGLLRGVFESTLTPASGNGVTLRDRRAGAHRRHLARRVHSRATRGTNRPVARAETGLERCFRTSAMHGGR